MNGFPNLLHVVRIALAVTAVSLGAYGLAGAQTEPSAGPPPPVAVPSQATPSYATPSRDEQIRGSIAAVTGKYTLQLRDERGFIDNVALHPGTIINPTGLKLMPGMPVTIVGHNAGGTFAANQIDAPYTTALVAPAVGFDFGFGTGWGWGPRYRAGFW